MKASTNRRALVLLNVVLGGLLVAISLAPSAQAQRGGGRGRGDYTLASGRIQGGNSNAIYVVDAGNQELVALRWNESTKGLEGIGYRDLRADAQAPQSR
ncbi:MAG: hypothetical protein ACKVW3_16555 [Phycisphaerales bacterium]